MYQAIARNRRNSWLLMFLFILLFAAVGFIFGEYTGSGYFGLVIAFLIALALCFGSYYYSDTIVLKATGARPAEKEEYPHLVNSIEGLAIGAGLPTPRLYIVDDPTPNAFATGRNPEKGVVAVTTGLIERLNRVEIEGVLAHEMAHIKNYDTRLATLAAVMVGAIVLLSEWMRRSFFFRSMRRSSSRNRKGAGPEAVIMVLGILMALLAPLFAQMLRLAISRKREFLADADGAMITRYPEGLASALEKISSDPQKLKNASQATAPLFIVNPFSTRGANNLFSTHPPITERVEALRKM